MDRMRLHAGGGATRARESATQRAQDVSLGQKRGAIATGIDRPEIAVRFDAKRYGQ
jgi:hypothetical protein